MPGRDPDHVDEVRCIWLKLRLTPELMTLRSSLISKLWFLFPNSSKIAFAFLLHDAENNQASWIENEGADIRHSETRTEFFQKLRRNNVKSSPEVQNSAVYWAYMLARSLARWHFIFQPLPRNWARRLWRRVLFILGAKACLSPSGLPRLWCLPSWYLVGTLASWIKSFRGEKKPFYFSSPRLFWSQDLYLSQPP